MPGVFQTADKVFLEPMATIKLHSSDYNKSMDLISLTKKEPLERHHLGLGIPLFIY
jgi:hypothetical protein